MKKLRVHVVYEHGGELHSHCSGHIRLIRPLGHPLNRDRVQLTWGRSYEGQPADVVIIERLWRWDIDLDKAERLVRRIRRAGAKILYSQDDNIHDLQSGMKGQDWLTDRHFSVMRLFQREAVGTLVSTTHLRDRLSEYGSRIAVVPNQLDERLLVAPTPAMRKHAGAPLRVGFMGTRSHDEDMEMIAPALAALMEARPNTELHVVGGINRPLPLGLKAIRHEAPTGDYPLFMLWFLSTMRWDIALAPLRDSAYARCKSDIKWLDYSALGAAGIYSGLAPYETVRDGDNGVVADNDPASWTHALLRLASDDAWRTSLIHRAWRELRETRTLAQHAHEWPDAIEGLLS